jgi:anti-sigma regulatory factor (Ser/Thr protein kinase)
MTGSAARLRLQALSDSANIAAVRAAIAAVGDAERLEDELIADVKTAATEACNNIVLHAYQGQAGPMCVELELEPASVRLLVSDEGNGFVPVAGRRRLGLGLPLIGALTRHAEFRMGKGGGTEVEMWFSRPVVGMTGPAVSWPARTPGSEVLGLGIWFMPCDLGLYVLPRVLTLLAAGRGYSLPGVERVRRAAACLARYTGLLASPVSHVVISFDHCRLEVAVALAAGAGRGGEGTSGAGLPAELVDAADAVRVHRGEDGDRWLLMELSYPGAARGQG